MAKLKEKPPLKVLPNLSITQHSAVHHIYICCCVCAGRVAYCPYRVTYNPIILRPVPTWMRVYSWHMVVVGVGGGILSFVNAVMSVEEKLKEGDSCWTVWFE